MFSYVSPERYGKGRFETQAPREIHRLLFADVSRLRSPHRVRTQNFEANAEQEVTAPVENEEDLTLPPQHGEDIELGLRYQEISIDALPSASKSMVKAISLLVLCYACLITSWSLAT